MRLGMLVIDSDPSMQMLFPQELADEGHNVTAAGSARHAIHLLRIREFDLVICDMGLPDLDGPDLINLGRIQQHRESPQFLAR
jgi:CheY-like chemotaxis protein